MSGTCAFLLKNAIKDLCLDLGRVTAQHLDAPRRTIYLGMDTGEIVSLKSEMLQEKITLSPKLLLSPSFETIKCEVVGLHVAETPFHNMTVGFCLLRTARKCPWSVFMQMDEFVFGTFRMENVC
jgi:hypothetical protein